MDKSTGVNTSRKGLQEILDKVKDGDTVICTRIDRLARSTRDLLGIVNKSHQTNLLIRKQLHRIIRGCDRNCSVLRH
ncbi:recombinase family protein [Jeotgalibacillus marinus]|uniref:Recombinase family protein n=1 Tax=Jeotgalibacillus marinus TaxID=86667 RepID=A0ABV3Q7M7_9BACL